MSLHYIVDGYNALHATGRWADLPALSGRRAFLTYLDEARLTGSEKNTLTIVLDGYAAELKNLRLKHARLIFSGDQDADSFIASWVHAMSNPRDAVVVTNDRGIHIQIKGSGARILSCEEFFMLKKRISGPKKSDKPDPESAAKINKELKRLWMLE